MNAGVSSTCSTRPCSECGGLRIQGLDRGLFPVHPVNPAAPPSVQLPVPPGAHRGGGLRAHGTGRAAQPPAHHGHQRVLLLSEQDQPEVSGHRRCPGQGQHPGQHPGSRRLEGMAPRALGDSTGQRVPRAGPAPRPAPRPTPWSQPHQAGAGQVDAGVLECRVQQRSRGGLPGKASQLVVGDAVTQLGVWTVEPG